MNDMLKNYFTPQKMMRTVLLALTPLVLFGVWMFGWRVALTLVVVLAAGIALEMFWEKRSGKKASEAVLVTCVLYTLTLPPDLPLWMAVAGILFGLFFGKLVFGGFGKNIFNPALVGRAFIYVNFPEPMTIAWNEAMAGFPGGFATFSTKAIDSVTTATPMILFKNNGELTNIMDLFTGTIPGAIGESAKLLIIVGAIYLVWKKVASWEIMVSCVLGFLVTNAMLYYGTDVQAMPPLHGLLSGGFLFGSVFMATDPISAAKTTEGKWIFGLIIGLTTVLIRTLALFNGGMMFAILIGNTFAPIVDYFVRESKAKAKAKRKEVAA